MSIVCCGIKYSKSDPETYWCIDTDVIKKKNSKIIVDTIACKKCGATIVSVTTYNLNKKVIGRERFSGMKAIDFLQSTLKDRVRMPQHIPIKIIPYAKKLDFVYGKVISSTQQRPRYLNDQDWASDDCMYMKCTATDVLSL